MIDQQQRQHLKHLLNRSTPGPWQNQQFRYGIFGPNNQIVTLRISSADAELCCTMKNLLPELLDSDVRWLSSADISAHQGLAVAIAEHGDADPMLVRTHLDAQGIRSWLSLSGSAVQVRIWMPIPDPPEPHQHQF